MKILVLGASGMLGHKLVQTMHARGIPVACTVKGSRNQLPLDQLSFFREVEIYEGVDALDQERLHRRLAELKPDVTINCVGVIKQRDEAKNPIPSITINSLLPHLLARWSEDWGGRLIHFSTDCVFSGRQGNYTVEDASDAEDLYGKSKYLGEVKAPNALTLRTSIIGRELSHCTSLVEWFLAQGGRPMCGFRKAMYSGMTTQTMADLIIAVLAHGQTIHGLRHAVSRKISKFDLLCLMRDAYVLPVNIEPDDEFVCDRSMLGSGLETEIGFAVPAWEYQIEHMAADPTPYGVLR